MKQGFNRLCCFRQRLAEFRWVFLQALGVGIQASCRHSAQGSNSNFRAFLSSVSKSPETGCN